MSTGRPTALDVGLLALRGYIIFAVIIMVIKLIQYTTAHH